MSYESENTLPAGTRIDDVREFMSLLGYSQGGTLKTKELGAILNYSYFEEADYKSWSGVGVSIYTNREGRIVVSTRTPVARSYFDLQCQNRTIAGIRKRFGGYFRTDEGRGRYMRVEGRPPAPAASGCYLAFDRLGGNLIKAKLCHEAREFPLHPVRNWKGIGELAELLDPRFLANNTLIPFLVAAIEDYFKSTFVALLRYSPRKEQFLRNVRLQGDQLLAISNGISTVEDQIVETLPFQRIGAIGKHFDALDQKLDIAGALRKPYRRRSQSFYDLLESLVMSRHDFIHRAVLDHSMSDARIESLIEDLDVALSRVYQRISDYYGWNLGRSWHMGGKRKASKVKPASNG